MLLLISLIGCSRISERKEGMANRQLQPKPHDLKEILASGKLVALTDYSSSSYFLYKGVPMGFEYEVLQAFADHIGVELHMKPVSDMDDITEKLLEKEGDIIAANYTVTNQRKRDVRFTEPLLQTRQVLVQKLPEGWWNYTREELNDRLIRNPVKLVGKDVHVRRHSSFYTRLINLMDEVGGIINVKFAEGLGTEKLIEMVSEGQIEYTVADENVAVLNKVYHPNIDVKTALSFNQKVAWACRPSSRALTDTLNQWLTDFKKTEEFAVIHLKYFKARTQHKERVLSEYSSLRGGKISPYDDLIKAGAKTLGWDWKLLAALIYQESKFDAEAQAWTGAAGLMQLIPETAQRFNASDPYDPTQNIEAGVAYLQTIQSYWQDTLGNDSTVFLPFVMASYNVGLGHLLDAQRLAVKHEGDPSNWEHVAAFLALKSQPQYYRDEVVRHGYCRGSEPVNYVKNIMLMWEHYRNAPFSRSTARLILSHPAGHS